MSIVFLRPMSIGTMCSKATLDSSDLVQSVQTIVQLFSSQLSLMLAWKPRIFLRSA